MSAIKMTNYQKLYQENSVLQKLIMHAKMLVQFLN